MIKVFFIFKVICLFTAIIITFANQNPVYAVLHLVTFFVTGSFLLLFLGVDFLPYVFIIVYAGAVAVLFLFVVIILKIKLGSTQLNYRNIIFMFFSSLGLSSFTYSLTFINQEIYNKIVINEDIQSNKPSFSCDRHLLLDYETPGELYQQNSDIYFCTLHGKKIKTVLPYPCLKENPRVVYTSDENFYTYDIQSSITNLGKILYTEYNIHFIVCGLILLVAIIGAISLTRGYNTSISLKQKIFIQTTRSSMIGKIII